jgi:DNA primase
MDNTAEVVSVDGREIGISHPAKLYFSKQVLLSKLDIVRYYLSIAPRVIRYSGPPDRIEAFYKWSGGGSFLSKASSH